MQAKDIKEFGLKEKIEQENNLIKGLKVKFTTVIIISNILTFSLSQLINDTSEIKTPDLLIETPKDHTLLKIKASLFIDETATQHLVSIMDQNEVIIYKRAIFYKKISTEGPEEEYLVYVPNSELKNFRPKNQNLYSIIPYINYTERAVLPKKTGGSLETYL